MISQILEIFILGLIAGAIPGPVLTAIFTEVINSGFIKSTKVTLKALAAETIGGFLTVLIISSLNIPTSYFHIIAIFGSIFMIWMASNVWRIKKINDEKGEIFTFLKIVPLVILNGGFWIFWISICVPRAFALRDALTGGQYLFMVVFESGWLFAALALSFIFSFFRPLLLKKNLVSTMFKFFAILLIFFALKSVYTSIVFLMN